MADKLFKSYQDVIQSDGYEAYSRFESTGGIVLLGCMAHMRRKFKHLATDDKNAAHIIETIATLYRLEKSLRHRKAPLEEVETERKAKAYPILKYLETYMLDIHKRYTPGETMEKALRYAFAVWVRIGRYVRNGRLNVDNNLMGRAIRPIILGRKNYLFHGNNEGVENNVVFYTFMACRRETDIDPYKWMKEILSKPLSGMTEEELTKILSPDFK